MPEQFITAAKIAYWYFRLNGFLNIENFVLHPLHRGPQQTEADICGVRFPYRSEMEMKDDGLFQHDRTKPLLIIAEVAKGQCKLNGPWLNAERKNMEYILRAIGAFKEEQIATVAADLYQHCVHPADIGKECDFQLIAVGRNPNEELQHEYPRLLQLTLADMLRFIHRRFSAYRAQKKDHSQWDSFGNRLFDEAEKRDEGQYVEEILKCI